MSISAFRIIFFICLLSTAALAQNPVSWSLTTDAKSLELKAGAVVNAELKAQIEEGWHLYALEQPAGGPFATTIMISEGKPIEINGKITSSKPIFKPDNNFIIDGKPLETYFFDNTATFKIPFKSISDTSVNSILIDVRFQVCDATRCLPPKTVRVSTTGFPNEVLAQGDIICSDKDPHRAASTGEASRQGANRSRSVLYAKVRTSSAPRTE